MGLLDNFEQGLERVVNGTFAKTFRSGLAPVEITSALRRELDTKAAVVSRDRILVPNNFTVRLGRTDFQRMSSMGSSLTDELTGLVHTHATAQGYQFAGAVTIRLSEDTSLSEGIIRIDSTNVSGEVAWTPVLEIAGKRHPLTRSRTVIGRGSDADITIDDTGTSRKHVEVLWDGKRAQVQDLGSTNGSKLNGEPVTKALLAPDSVITIGRTRIVFRVLAQTVDPSAARNAGRERGSAQ
ncbi:FhaA domain-containing protein [Marisediminicola sp. LYQ134]|uniref:FhaA domain-containing protein n=1 Tax=unclassified Marisediminicola TaxID=2618316 RepID=UPI003982FE43